MSEICALRNNKSLCDSEKKKQYGEQPTSEN